jgi:putative tryptophan/tyrosine transport system substrate-binding protein
VRRRQFILLFCGAAITLPRVALAQKPDRVRRIGVLMGISESDPEARGWFATFVEELARLGWIDGRNARIERRWTNADIKRTSALAKELLAGPPDVILAVSTPATAALHRETSIVPIVFVPVSDPVGAGFVASIARLGGNITGFTQTDAGLGGKWLGLLKEIAPGIKRAGILFNPDTAPGGGDFFLGSFEAAARAQAVEPVTMRVRSDAEIEVAIAALGRERAGLVMMDDAFMGVHQATVISSSARNNMPAISQTPGFVRDGGLIAYGGDFTDLFRRAAGYVDRILRGEKPADLPVQMPTKFLTAINLKTAKALGLDVPAELLAMADEVIE